MGIPAIKGNNEPALPQATGLIGALSEAIIEMVGRVGPSIVQVQHGGHGGGAGVIWRSDGGIVTNHHVVAGDRGPLSVVLRDGRSLSARVQNSNAELDLALLKVEATDLAAAPVADSKELRIGELVFAVGHPWGQRDVVTAGIVSALGDVPVGRSGKSAQYIRSDVRLAPGNSGGPLINAQGAVVGINAMIFGGDLGVAIPSHVAATWVAGVPSRRVYLGVGLQPVEIPASYGEPNRGGAQALMISAVEPDGPAARAGLLVGDVLLDVSGKKVPDADSLFTALGPKKGGDKVRLRVLRAQSPRTIDVKLGSLEA